MSNRPQYLLNAQGSDLAVGANTDKVTLSDSDYTINVWSPGETTLLGQVDVYMEAQDGTPVLIESFTEPGVRYGKIGQMPRKLLAGCSGVSGAGVSCSITT